MKRSNRVWTTALNRVCVLLVGAGVSLVAFAASARATDSPSAPSGPDVTIIYLNGISNYGSSGGIRGYSLGTTSCNVGTEPLNWCNDNGAAGCGDGTTDEDHPVIAQNLYRLRSGRFEQIGMSWLKHGFLSTNSTDTNCGPSCQSPPLGSDQLGVGCTDAYGSGLNGSTPLGKRSEVDATTGAFLYPYTQVSPGTLYDQRIKVAEADLDPGGSDLYWMEGQYVAPDDAATGNGFNNASYASVTVSPGSFNIGFSSATVREKTALYGWQVADAGVEIANVDFTSHGSSIVERFEVARRITPPAVAHQGPGPIWHYEIVVRNMNSDRAARVLRIEIPGATISGAGFHDIDHHSGEPYDTTDWTIDTTTPGVVEWSTDESFANSNANALRWATTFTFWFDVDQDPSAAIHRLELFELGCPMTAFFTVPNELVFADSFECSTTGLWSVEGP